MTQPGSGLQPKTEELFPGLTFQRAATVDTITWSNRRIPKNSLLYAGFIAGLLLAIPLALFLTSRLLTDLSRAGQNLTLNTGELMIAAFFILASWGAIVIIGHYLIRLSWVETIKISNDELLLQYQGLFAPRSKSITAHRIWCMSFERVGNERDQESRFTLNLFDIDDKRQILAYWLRAEENYRLFLLLETLFHQRGWSVQTRSNFKARASRQGDSYG